MTKSPINNKGKSPIDNIKYGHQWLAEYEVLEEVIYMEQHGIEFNSKDSTFYREDISPKKVYKAARKFSTDEDGKFIGKDALVELAREYARAQLKEAPSYKTASKTPLNELYPWPEDVDPRADESLEERILRVGELAKAICTVYAKGNREASLDAAEHIMSLFGYEYTVVDNQTQPNDRGILWELFIHGGGIIQTDSEETTLRRGEPWRIHWWVLNKDKILKLAYPATYDKENYGLKEIKEEDSIYDKITDSQWARDVPR